MRPSVNSLSRRTLAMIGAVLFFLAVTAASSWAVASEGNVEESAANDEIKLVKVDPKYVCMPNNRLFKKEQLSTEIEGETYYGCCKMCINALNSDPQQRLAIDPVSGNEINKAKAIIGAAPDNSIYYFESEENLENFRLAAAAEE